MLDEVRKALGVFKREHREDEQERERLLQKREFYLESALPKEELLAFCIEQLASVGKRDFERFANHNLEPYASKPLSEFHEQSIPALLGFFQNPREVQAPILFFLLREPLEKALRAALSDWEFPGPIGPSRETRLRELPKLERKIDALEKKIESRQLEAKNLGIELGQVHQREPVARRKPTPTEK